MPLRLSGLVSGMDTESIVAELMKAQRLKETGIKNNITKLEWKQEKWKDFNKKIYSFYTSQLSKIRMQGSFNTMKATSSNMNKAEVTADNKAPAGNHTLRIKEVASGQYVTGSVIPDISNKPVSYSTKLTELGFDASEGTTITIETGIKKVSLDVGSYTTVQNFTDACKSVGLNASYDTTQKRFFISSKESGVENTFYITTSSTALGQEREDIRDLISYGSMSGSQKETVDKALMTYINSTDPAAKTKAYNDILTAYHSRVRADYIQGYKSNQENIDRVTDSEKARLTTELGEEPSASVLQKAVETKLTQEATAAVDAEYNVWKDTENPAPDTNVFKAAENSLSTAMQEYATASSDALTQTNTLADLGLTEIFKDTDGSAKLGDESAISFVKASDAEIIFDNAEITSSSNNLTVNGITLNLVGKTGGFDTVTTADDEVISIGISKDTKSVYDMIKNFVKSYNELLTGLNEAYNAPTAKGYEPLTDEQKDTMSESQIDKWEDKIKESLLRRDDTINSITSSIRSIMMQSVEIDGKKYSLSNIGVTSANYTEKGLLHIKGDADDTIFSANDNELMEALNEDPDKVMKIFSEIAGDIYKDLTDKMSRTSLRSALTFYNDKEMSNTLTDYKEDLKNMEKKLKEMEDRYFKQFSAMESAMAKMNSQSSSLAQMLGMGQ